MLNEDSLERELSCGICFELYNEPLQLPCMHTFCKSCLKDIIACSKNKKLKCPDCRRNVELGRTGVDSLKRNFKLASIVEIYRQAAEKLVSNEASQQPSKSARSPSPVVVEKDYEFLSNVLQSSQEDATSPFEPHIIDDLWGTFKRTARKNISVSSRPPAPLPPRPQPVGSSSSRPSSRPLPPIPRPVSRDLSNRPLPPDPSTLLGPDSPQGGLRTPTTPTASPPVNLFPEPSAPPYEFASPTQSTHSSEDDLFDIASLSQAPPIPTVSGPPIPPRRSFPTSSNHGPKSMGNRPPIPVPRSKGKTTPVSSSRDIQSGRDGRHKDSKTDSLVHRPPPPLPRGRQS